MTLLSMTAVSTSIAQMKHDSKVPLKAFFSSTDYTRLTTDPITSWTRPVSSTLSFNAKKSTAFFCVMESNLQQSTRLPLFFRLGSLDYANYLEGKNNHGPILHDTSKRH